MQNRHWSHQSLPCIEVECPSSLPFSQCTKWSLWWPSNLSKSIVLDWLCIESQDCYATWNNELWHIWQMGKASNFLLGQDDANGQWECMNTHESNACIIWTQMPSAWTPLAVHSVAWNCCWSHANCAPFLQAFGWDNSCLASRNMHWSANSVLICNFLHVPSFVLQLLKNVNLVSQSIWIVWQSAFGRTPGWRNNVGAHGNKFLRTYLLL